MRQNLLGGWGGVVVKTQIAGSPSLAFLIQDVWAGARWPAFLTNSQVRLLLLVVWTPGSENWDPTAKEGSRRENFRGTFVTAGTNECLSQSIHLLALSLPFLLYLISFLHPHLSFFSFVLFLFLFLIANFYFYYSPFSFSCVLVSPHFFQPFYSFSQPYPEIFPRNN